jgi:subtilase family serine protease
MKKTSILSAVIVVTLALSAHHARVVLGAEGGQLPVLITQPIDDTQLVTLAGNTRPEANAAHDRGRLADSFPVQHMLLQLKRSPELEHEFALSIESLTDKLSPDFRHWITAIEQGERYGLAQQDLETITGWLRSHGFEVGYVYPNRMVIDFSGTAGEIREAFHTELHELEVKGQLHFANMSDPKIPAALAPAVTGVVSLHNFKPHAFNLRRPDYTFGCSSPFTTTCHALVPADFETIYNLNPLYSAGITGKGETVVVVEDSNSFDTDWSAYQKKFGLTNYGGTLTTVHPNSAGNCTNPGANADDVEADLDAEMVTAFAPGAAVELASCTDTATFGGLLAIENLVSAGSPPPIISMSYGNCEAANGVTANAAFRSAFQSAAAAGVSVFVAAGDSGASSCSEDFSVGEEFAVSGIGVTGWGETVYNVSVGGTDFEDLYNSLESGTPQSTYWNSTNSSTFGSAKSYIPEIPWNDSCASFLIYTAEGFSAPYGTSGFCNSAAGEIDFLTTAAGGGGPSGCATGAANPVGLYIEDTTCQGYAKPSWQSGIFGNPSDGVRDIPDVSLFASDGVWGHFVIICFSDTANPIITGIPCTGAPDTWVGVGGTSVSSPAMAAIQALVDEKWSIRAGNPNPTYYSIAKREFGSSGNSTCYSIKQTQAASNCVFYDVTEGDNDINCQYNGTAFLADCYRPSGTTGTLGTQAISSLTLRSGGSGYTSPPTCTISVEPNKSKYLSPTGTTIYGGGVRAACTAKINTTTKSVTAVTLTNRGQGYTGVPNCTLSGGGGTGATCVAVIRPTTGAAAHQPSFGATPGWDMATGIGTVNAYQLVLDSAW